MDCVSARSFPAVENTASHILHLFISTFGAKHYLRRINHLRDTHGEMRKVLHGTCGMNFEVRHPNRHSHWARKMAPWSHIAPHHWAQVFQGPAGPWIHSDRMTPQFGVEVNAYTANARGCGKRSLRRKPSRSHLVSCERWAGALSRAEPAPARSIRARPGRSRKTLSLIRC
jgi:hypothetical protein